MNSTEHPGASLYRAQTPGDIMRVVSVQAGVGDEKPGRRANLTWRTFWGAHQRFFRHLCMAAKVPGLVRMSQVRAYGPSPVLHFGPLTTAVELVA